jgi:hypothetical protein
MKAAILELIGKGGRPPLTQAAGRSTEARRIQGIVFAGPISGGLATLAALRSVGLSPFPEDGTARSLRTIATSSEQNQREEPGGEPV